MIDPASFVLGLILAIPTWEFVVEPLVVPSVAHRLRGLAQWRRRMGHVGKR